MAWKINPLIIVHDGALAVSAQSVQLYFDEGPLDHGALARSSKSASELALFSLTSSFINDLTLSTLHPASPLVNSTSLTEVW